VSEPGCVLLLISNSNELLLHEMRIALPANVSPRLFNKNEKDLFCKPVFLQYKKAKFPVLKYLNALLEDFDLEINPPTIIFFFCVPMEYVSHSTSHSRHSAPPASSTS
jgi:hypothetical protein